MLGTKNDDRVLSFNDIFDEYKLLTESDKVYKNTSDDYKLGSGWVYVGGGYDKNNAGKWTAIYAKVAEKAEEECYCHMCEGPVRYIGLLKQIDKDSYAAIASDHTGISKYIMTRNLLDIPEEIKALIA